MGASTSRGTKPPKLTDSHKQESKQHKLKCRRRQERILHRHTHRRIRSTRQPSRGVPKQPRGSSKSRRAKQQKQASQAAKYNKHSTHHMHKTPRQHRHTSEGNGGDTKARAEAAVLKKATEPNGPEGQFQLRRSRAGTKERRHSPNRHRRMPGQVKLGLSNQCRLVG